MTGPSNFDDSAGPEYVDARWHTPLERITPSLVELAGGGHLLYAGMTHALSAPSGSGKSWVALAAMLATLRETSKPVLLLDYEASIEVAITRLRQLGATLADATLFAYWRLDHAIKTDRARQLGAWVDQHQPSLAVLDGVTRATALYGVDADSDNAGYTTWASELQLACRANGGADDPAVLLIDHVSEKTGGGLNARGVTAKRDTVTGASYMLRGRVSPTRPSNLSLITAKSRHGGEQDTPAARVTTQPHDDGHLQVAFLAPSGTTGAAEGPLGDVCARVREALRAEPLSTRALCTQVGGDDKATRRAIAHLAAGGHIVEDTHAPKRGGHHPYRLAPPSPEADHQAA